MKSTRLPLLYVFAALVLVIAGYLTSERLTAALESHLTATTANAVATIGE